VSIVTGAESALPRCKPFKYTYEKEIVMYVAWASSRVLLPLDTRNDRHIIVPRFGLT